MEFSVGDVLQVDGGRYRVIGKILYRNTDDNCRWSEYRLKQMATGEEQWLSYDEAYNEYSLTRVVGNISRAGFHEADRGTEEVLSVWGKVDVKPGDKAAFYEYEDSTEEKIISSEIWDDGEEISTGYYLDWDEVSICREPDNMGSSGFSAGQSSWSGNTRKSAGNHGMKLITVIIGLIALVSVGTGLAAAFSGKNYITSYLKKNTTIFTYETSITGNNKQKADVYRSAYDLDTTVKSILSGIQGKTEDVQQNTEDGDNSVAILTKDEYCLVYESEDDEVLVQVSSRKYAYTTDKAPYHAHSYTHHYYRRYYYSRGYQNDSGSFGKYTSPYSSYDGDTLTKNNVDIYDTYSSNIRQSSVNRRSSSGGGLSSGK